MKKFSMESGFSLVELMVVISIVSLSASILVPRYLKHRIKERQGICLKNLQLLHQKEKDFFEKNNRFTKDYQELGWQPKDSVYYQYQFRETADTGFFFECQGNIDKDPTLDHASINETGQIEHLSDDIKK